MNNIIKNIGDFMMKPIKDGTGVSSKRVIGLAGTTVLFALMTWNVLKGIDGTSTASLIDYAAYIVIVSLFGTSAEKIFLGKHELNKDKISDVLPSEDAQPPEDDVQSTES